MATQRGRVLAEYVLKTVVCNGALLCWILCCFERDFMVMMIGELMIAFCFTSGAFEIAFERILLMFDNGFILERRRANIHKYHNDIRCTPFVLL